MNTIKKMKKWEDTSAKIVLMRRKKNQIIRTKSLSSFTIIFLKRVMNLDSPTYLSLNLNLQR